LALFPLKVVAGLLQIPEETPYYSDFKQFNVPRADLFITVAIVLKIIEARLCNLFITGHLRHIWHQIFLNISNNSSFS
jgi:hypothetical protein